MLEAATLAVGPLIDQLAAGAFPEVVDSLVGEVVADNLSVAFAQTSVEDRELESVAGQEVQISVLAIDQTWVLVVFPERAALVKGANDLAWGQVTLMLAISGIETRTLETLATTQAILETLEITTQTWEISGIETRTSAILGTTLAMLGILVTTMPT